MRQTRLSVNINKVATLRNARGGNNPNVLNVALALEEMGADGITVHPRPDERHITRQDVLDLRPRLTTEFNMEGFPDERFITLVLQMRPHQVTLVPDTPDQLTSNHGWDTTRPENEEFLTPIVKKFKEAGIRVSIFVDARPEMAIGAARIGADRIELYTEPYAAGYASDKETAVRPLIETAEKARALHLGINAGHDLSLENLKYLKQQIPWLDEVSIGHALISDALFFGFQETIKRYKECLK